MYRVALFLLCMSCNAEDPWILAKIKGKGSLLDKARFLQYYAIEPGNQFDEQQHGHSVKKIIEEMQGEGYLATSIEDTIRYHEDSHTVTVILSLKPGIQYTVDEILVNLNGPLQPKIKKILEQEITSASQDGIIKATERLRSYLSKKGYAHPKIVLTKTRDDSREVVHLVYDIDLNKKKQYVFEGNLFFSSAELQEEIASLEAMALPTTLLIEDIETLYKKKGFWQVEIECKDDSEQLLCTITEGPRSLIEQVTLLGVPPEQELLLKKALQDIYTTGYYDEEILHQVLAQGMLELAGQGYWHATIIKKDTKHIEDDIYELILEVIPGQQIQIVSLRIPSYPELEAEQVFKDWKDGDLRPLPPQVVEEQRRWLQQHFRQKGYFYVGVTHEILDDQLIWHIDTKEPVRFGKTNVAGLQRMKPKYVLRELQYHEGDIWSKEKIEQSVKRLKDLHMFESVSITSQGSDPLAPEVLIKCVEDDPFEIRTRLGFQIVSKSFTHLSWTTYKLGATLVWKSPTQQGDRLFFDADITRYDRNLALSYEVPWIGPCPIRTLFNIYSNRFDQPLISSSHHRLYKEAHDGFSVTFYHDHPLWRTFVRTGFEVNKLSDIAERLVKVIQFDPALVDKPTPYFYCEPSVLFEYLDNKLDPCKGVLTNLSLKAMAPPSISEGWFVRALIEQSLFYPLFRNFIGALRWRIGHIFSPCFTTIFPTERFYLGGASSLRGYETNMAPPLNELPCDKFCFWVPVGGKSMVNVNMEVRFPIYKRLSGVIFTDMGVLSQDRFADIAANQWLGATGFGLRVATPIAPLRFDIGWKWRKRVSEDKSFAWFLTMGHAF